MLLAQNARKPNNRDTEAYAAWTDQEWKDAVARFTEAKPPVPRDGDEDDVFAADENKAVIHLVR